MMKSRKDDIEINKLRENGTRMGIDTIITEIERINKNSKFQVQIYYRHTKECYHIV